MKISFNYFTETLMNNFIKAYKQKFKNLNKEVKLFTFDEELYLLLLR